MLALALALAVSAAPAEPGAEREWQRVIGLLQYLESDYPIAVASQAELELQEQSGFADEIHEALTGLGPAGAPYVQQWAPVRAHIHKGEDVGGVVAASGQLAQKIVTEQKLQKGPRHVPDLKRGAELYAVACARCHGVDGRADTEIAQTLEPKPFNFHEPEAMGAATPFKAFNTISFGVTGTGMPAFESLEEDERWALAFYVFTLRLPACEEPLKKKLTLERLATTTDHELLRVAGEKQFICMRRKLPEPDKTSTLARAHDGIEQARKLYAMGQHEAARVAVVDAYLEGLEPVEPLLRARSPGTVQKLEEAFTRTRLAAQRSEKFDEESKALLALLAEEQSGPAGESTGGKAAFWSVLIAALLILLREGFEAVVVVGALLAVLKKMNAPALRRTVHYGWSSALAVGALAFIFGRSLFAGANREWMETIVAFIAVGMLLYAALWLNARANMSRFMGELREKATAAIAGGTGLFVVSFTAVLRESVETALFLQGLANDSFEGAVAGAALGLLALAVLMVIVSRVGFVLPMKTLFSASTVLLVATAVMLLGMGVNGLQELGLLPLLPLPLPRVPALGLFADVFTVVPQVLLALGAWVFAKKTKPASRVSVSQGSEPASPAS